MMYLHRFWNSFRSQFAPPTSLAAKLALLVILEVGSAVALLAERCKRRLGEGAPDALERLVVVLVDRLHGLQGLPGPVVVLGLEGAQRAPVPGDAAARWEEAVHKEVVRVAHHPEHVLHLRVHVRVEVPVEVQVARIEQIPTALLQNLNLLNPMLLHVHNAVAQIGHHPQLEHADDRVGVDRVVHDFGAAALVLVLEGGGLACRGHARGAPR
mmetsp:Transcript_84018/g.232855  ORF Transcript_84018/g.232855 Transcript_84018/m.232855 type:complete len:212 (-) Transcript_84018:606-1241(-)